MQPRNIAFLSIIGGFLAACGMSVRGDRTIYDKEKDQYISTPFGEGKFLKAGEKQELEFSFSEPMEMVYGVIGGTTIQFVPTNVSSQTWYAEFVVPKFSRLGADKYMRIFAADLGGEPIVDSTGPVPGAWLRRGENGEFPMIPEEYRHIAIPIRER